MSTYRDLLRQKQQFESFIGLSENIFGAQTLMEDIDDIRWSL